jgi:hypothetical protein
MGQGQPSVHQSVFRWLRDVVDHKVGHGLLHSLELETKLFLHDLQGSASEGRGVDQLRIGTREVGLY